jgi:hypothetical protein
MTPNRKSLMISMLIEQRIRGPVYRDDVIRNGRQFDHVRQLAAFA